MILDAKHGKRPVAKALNRPVIQVHICDLEVRSAGNPCLAPLHGKPVVLGGDQHAPCGEFLDWVVPTTVPVGKLVRPAPVGESEDLMPEADPEDRHALGRYRPDCGGCVGDGLGITRSVGQEDAVRPVAQDVLGARRRRHDRDAAAQIGETAQDVPLGAVIDGDDAVTDRGQAAVAAAEPPDL